MHECRSLKYHRSGVGSHESFECVQKLILQKRFSQVQSSLTHTHELLKSPMLDDPSLNSLTLRGSRNRSGFHSFASSPHISGRLFVCLVTHSCEHKLDSYSPIVGGCRNIDRRSLLNRDRCDLFARLGCDRESQRKYIVPTRYPGVYPADRIQPHRFLPSRLRGKWEIKQTKPYTPLTWLECIPCC